MSFFVEASMHEIDKPYTWGPFRNQFEAREVLLALARNPGCDGATIRTGEELDTRAQRMWRAGWLKYRMGEKPDRPKRDFYFCWDLGEPA